MAKVEIVPPKNDWRILIHEVLRVGDNLDAEFRRQAYLVGRAGFFSAQAKQRVRQLKNELEVVSARLRKRIRLKRGKLTNDEMRYAVELKKAYRDKQRELETAMYEDDMLKSMLNALEHKKDCLVQLGANARHELPDELRLLAKSIGKKVRR